MSSFIFFNNNKKQNNKLKSIFVQVVAADNYEDYTLYDCMHHDKKYDYSTFISAIDTAEVKDVFTGSKKMVECLKQRILGL